MHRRHTRLAAAFAAATLALGTAAVAATTQTAGAQTARAAQVDPSSPVGLWAPARLTAYSYEGQVYTDLGLKLIAGDKPFEVWSHRASYDQPITSEWRVGNGAMTALPDGTLDSFAGLPDFLDVTVTRVKTGAVSAHLTTTTCLNGWSQRVHPDAPPSSPYPGGCPWNAYTVGSVMGVQAGHAVPAIADYSTNLVLKPGKYDVVATIADEYVDLFGIAPADTTATTRMTVKRESFERPATPRASDVLTPAAHEPKRSSAGHRAPGDPMPDLQSLPAWDIQLNRKGTAIRFAATVWNAGDSPLVIDGFRTEEDEDTLTTYQYFFDTDGNQTGHQEVGVMNWHAQNHNHWHFEDFAQYRLLNEDMSEAVLSNKQSFCLANTDAVDYTVEGADWKPEGTDLSTACAGFDALSVREVLSSGSGDTYMQFRYGQAFPIDDVPNGTYYIAVEANPVLNLVESDYDNNNAYRKIVLKGKGEKRKVVVEKVGIIDEGMPPWM